MNSDYIIAEDFTLPSLGKVYEKDVNPNVKLRSMTVNEEMKRLNKTDRPYKSLTEIIDDCLVEKPGISSYDMCMGDYIFLLHRLRIVTYGKDYKLSTICPYCGVESGGSINLEDLKVKQFDDALYNKYKTVILPKTQHTIKLKMQTPRMIDDIALKNKESKKQYNTESAFIYTLEQIIDTIDGDKLDPVKLEDFIRSIPMVDINYLSKSADKLNDLIGVEAVLDIECDICGLDYRSPFRYTDEFFGPSID